MYQTDQSLRLSEFETIKRHGYHALARSESSKSPVSLYSTCRRSTAVREVNSEPVTDRQSAGAQSPQRAPAIGMVSDYLASVVFRTYRKPDDC
jgi:hypothetical protein